MKTSIFLSFIFLAIGGAIGYFKFRNNIVGELLDAKALATLLFGSGLGLFLGAIIGYFSKSSQVRDEKRKQKEIEKLARLETENKMKEAQLEAQKKENTL